MKYLCALLVVASVAEAAPVSAGMVEQMLDRYRQQGAGPFDPGRGRAIWTTDFNGRSCTNCHGEDIRVAGKHQTTGKSIEPLAPSVNPQRLTDTGEIAKWLLRNCKWTLGRECSAQEKGDVLNWMVQQ